MASNSSQFLYSSRKLHFLKHHNNKLLIIKQQSSQVRSQLSKDEGKSERNNIVDANISILRERIAQVKKKEINRGRQNNNNNTNNNNNGWYHDYDDYYKINRKRDGELIKEFVGLIGFVARAIGLVFLSGSLSICLVSFLVHYFST